MQHTIENDLATTRRNLDWWFAEAQRLRAGPEWQPIETAPKDGSVFAICCAGDDPNEIEVGSYDPTKGRRFNLRPDGLYEAEEYTLYEWRGFNNMQRATHWIPLPPPPETD